MIRLCGVFLAAGLLVWARPLFVPRLSGLHWLLCFALAAVALGALLDHAEPEAPEDC